MPDVIVLLAIFEAVIVVEAISVPVIVPSVIIAEVIKPHDTPPVAELFAYNTVLLEPTVVFVNVSSEIPVRMSPLAAIKLCDADNRLTTVFVALISAA